MLVNVSMSAHIKPPLMGFTAQLATEIYLKMINIQLTPAQLQIAQDKHRYRIICAGRRFGKSTLARMLLLQMMTAMPGLYWIVSPTFTQSVQNHWREILREFPQNLIVKKYEGRSVTVRTTQSENKRKELLKEYPTISALELETRIQHLYSTLELKGADNPDTLRGVKLRGLCVDEIASIRAWSWLWNEVLSATLLDYSAPAIFIGTPKGYNHFYELFNLGQRTEGEYKSWRFSSYDNPTIKAEEINKKKEDMLEDVFMQEYMADFRKYTGLVYKEFDRQIHVKDMSLEEFQPIYWMKGLDRGFTNPTAVSIVAVNKDGDWYQTHELYKTGLTNSQLHNELLALDDLAGVPEYEYETMDSAAASDIAELNGLGHSFIGVVKQSGETNLNYVRYKIQRWADRLRVNPASGRPRYIVHPRNVKTIWEHETYSWPEKKDQLSNDSEQPLKLNDHIVDELADLNAMHEHYFEEKSLLIGAGKIPGTYIPASDETQDANFKGDNDINFFDDDMGGVL